MRLLSHVALACLCSLLLCSAARANMAKWWHEGERYGPLVPQQDSAVRVDSEDLEFIIAPSLERASVNARYRMTNGGAGAASMDIAFVVVASERAESRGDPSALVPHAAISLDGVALPFQVVTDGEALAPALGAWLASHPEIEQELQRLTAPAMEPRFADYAELRKQVPACAGECDELLRWYRRRGSDGERPLVKRAAELAIPEAVAKLQGGWSTFAQRRPLAWLMFHVDIAAGATRTVMVTYEHRAGSDASLGVNETFTYEYLLSPAKRWASFGPLHLTVRAPPDARVLGSLPLTLEQGVYRADLPTLPAGELTLRVMSTRGLLFGMTTPTGYWSLLIAVITLVTIALSAGLGRVWRRAPTRLGVVLRCIFGTGPIVGIVNGGVMWLVGEVFPRHALGIGYGPGLSMMLLYVGAELGGMMVSGLSARARET